MGARKKSAKGRAIAAVLSLIVIFAVGYVGWNWLNGLTVQRIEVSGHQHADARAIVDAARIDSGGRLLDVDPALIADRVRRHPWVEGADVRRLPPGMVDISVEERVPVALALSADGRPTAYLDRGGYVMPLVPGAVYDLPLVRGIAIPENAVRPVELTSVLELLPTLGKLKPRVNALVSTFEVDGNGDVTLHTTPAGTHGSIDVRLGKRGFAEKFERLEAFWMQAVLSRPEKTFRTIDLRFDGQIVTHES